MLDIIRALRVLKRQITMHSIENVPNYREKYQVLHNLQPIANLFPIFVLAGNDCSGLNNKVLASVSTPKNLWISSATAPGKPSVRNEIVFSKYKISLASG